MCTLTSVSPSDAGVAEPQMGLRSLERVRGALMQGWEFHTLCSVPWEPFLDFFDLYFGQKYVQKHIKNSYLRPI